MQRNFPKDCRLFVIVEAKCVLRDMKNAIEDIKGKCDEI